MSLSKLLRAAAIAALSFALVAGAVTAKPAAKMVDKAAITKIIRSEMAETIAGINAHDVTQATKWESDAITTMDAGRPPSMNVKEDRDGMAMAFKGAPSWRVRMIEDSIAVDVADAGDMAVYRLTAWQDSNDDAGTPMTQKVNFIAGFKKQKDGAWKMNWSAVVPQERPHKK